MGFGSKDRAAMKAETELKVVALAGNPNVGKSTVFNGLTGLKQHTGNWPGKTVASAEGRCRHGGHLYRLVDLPGTYSLAAKSAEEEVTRDFLCFDKPDAVLLIADATCLERNLLLVLQTLEITGKAVLCVNLLDEAKKKKIQIDLAALRRELGIAVVGASARSKRGLDGIMEALGKVGEQRNRTVPVRYGKEIEDAVAPLAAILRHRRLGHDPRWLAFSLAQGDGAILRALEEKEGHRLLEDGEIRRALDKTMQKLADADIDRVALRDRMAAARIKRAEEICRRVLRYEKEDHAARDRRLDRVFTSRRTGIPVMLLLLALIFWITIAGANIPSQCLAAAFSWLEGRILDLALGLGLPAFLYQPLIFGVYRVATWVVAVMLPPMAIFFPLFTLLEDAGYLPRVAFNLDRQFKRCAACGKQALTMAMGFGCNAAGVTGCRIIDSPRERLIAIVTNSLVPCNGRFPTLIVLVGLFFFSGIGGIFSSLLSALFLTGLVLVSVAMTFAASRFLSKTLLKGVPSSFILELPPYRRPQIGSVLVRSLLDRTIFILGRAVLVAAPAGLVIWVFANITLGEMSLLGHMAAWLDPFARLVGLDGYILIGFILGFPANEIVLPLILMAYQAEGMLMDVGSAATLGQVLQSHGWTWVTALCVIVFALFHWPCSTTCLTILKETRSKKWTLVSILLPTAIGFILCFLIANLAKLFGFV